MSKKKNISKKVPNGRLLNTNDKYFYKSKGFDKRRMAVVVDSNIKNELAIVKLTTADDGIVIKDYKLGKSKFKPGEMYTADDRNMPINTTSRDKLNNLKFVEDKRASRQISKKDVNFIKKELVNDKRFGSRNTLRLKKLKGRDKK